MIAIVCFNVMYVVTRNKSVSELTHLPRRRPTADSWYLPGAARKSRTGTFGVARRRAAAARLNPQRTAHRRQTKSGVEPDVDIDRAVACHLAVKQFAGDEAEKQGWNRIPAAPRCLEYKFCEP